MTETSKSGIKRQAGKTILRILMCIIIAFSFPLPPSSAYAEDETLTKNTPATSNWICESDSPETEPSNQTPPLPSEETTEMGETQDINGRDKGCEGTFEDVGKDPISIDGSLYPIRDEYLEESVDFACMGMDHSPCDDERTSPIDEVLRFFGLVDDKAFKDSGHTLYMKYSLFDQDILREKETLDSVFLRPDWQDVLFAQYCICTDLMDPGSNCDFYVALADISDINGAGTIKDHVFAELSNDGVEVEGPFIDYETGIAYVPKNLYFDPDSGKEKAYALQCQLMLASSLEQNNTTYVDLHVENRLGNEILISDRSVECATFDNTVCLPILYSADKQDIDLSQLHVRINGSESELTLENGNNATYDVDKAQLELFLSPVNLISVDVTIDKPSLFAHIVDKAHASTSSSLAYVPDIVFDSLDFNTLHISQSFTFETIVGYWWQNVDPYDYSWQACVNSGAYCYSWISDPDSLYEYVAWNEGANWDGVSSRNLSSFTVSADSTQAARNYFNYMFYLTGDEKGGQNWHSEKWPIFCDWDPGWGGAHFGLQCSHASNPVGNGVSASNTGIIKARVLDLELNVEKPYIVMSFVGPAIANQPGVGIYKFAVEAKGKVSVVKNSLIPDITSSNSMYDFAQISYDIYKDSTCTDRIASITLDENGHGQSPALFPGTYYIRENSSSCTKTGYVCDLNVYTAVVSSGQTVSLDLNDTPQSARFDILIEKKDRQLASSAPQGNATLKGAEFSVSYYDFLSDDVDYIDRSTPTRNWVFATDENGKIELSDAFLERGDALYRNSEGIPCIPLGTISIEEIKAPEGYLLDSNSRQIRQITSTGDLEIIKQKQFSPTYDEVIRGGVWIEKRDKESGLESALGQASLDNTRFSIVNANDHSVVVGGIEYLPGQIVYTLTITDSVASTAPDLLPYGNYFLQEIEVGEGYLLSDSRKRPFSIEENGQMVGFEGDDAAYNQVMRGDLEFVKLRASDQKRLGKVAFMLTSKTTGEHHILVTDENGIVKTTSEWNPHTFRTNRNDEALADDGSLDAGALSSDSGVWFGKAEDGSQTRPDDSLGALPYDTYSLTELRCDANEGLELIEIEDIAVKRDKVCIDIGTISNYPEAQPYISTSAYNPENSTKEIFVDKNAEIADRVTYTEIDTRKSYLLIGSLHFADTGDIVVDASSNPIQSEMRFEPESRSGYVDIRFEIDTTLLSGRKIVCFEQLIDEQSGNIVASHEDKDDIGQTVYVTAPSIGTFATNFESGSKVFQKGHDIKISDTVFYNNIAKDKTYTLTGKVMKKETNEEGEVFATPLLDSDGNPIQNSIEISTFESSGSTSVCFDIGADLTASLDKIVVYETLSSDGIDYVSHSDPENTAQTLEASAPSISTFASDTEDGDKYIDSTSISSIVDEVSYSNLEANAAYTLSGKLMVASDSLDEDATDLLDDNGCTIETSREFIPYSSEGVECLQFTFDPSGLEGKRIVCFEYLFRDDVLVAEHADATSLAQSVYPYRKTTSEGYEDSTLPKTGDDTAKKIMALISLIVVTGSMVYLFSRKSLARSRDCRSTSKSCSMDSAG